MSNLRDYTLTFVGLPYIWGGDDTIKGFDCSGLVQELLASEGMDPPGDQTAQALFDHFHDMSEHRDLGALAFYGRSIASITHVAMLLNEYQIIEAGGGGSKTVNAEVAAQQNAYVRIRRVDARKDLIAIRNPFVPRSL